MSPVYELDPLRDPRWHSLLQRHRNASVFHSVGWLESLHRTYGYEPVVLSTSPPTADLDNGLLFCRIRSWLTGNRIVSLPFSDHCEPLTVSKEEFDILISSLQVARARHRWKYIEVRPVDASLGDRVDKLGFHSVANYVLHRIDLKPPADEIFHGFDKHSVQRRVRHAERVGVVEVAGRSQKHLKDFYQLMTQTRARHNIPPQPYAWFRNLFYFMGDAVDLRLAYAKNAPVAAVWALHFKDTSYYKYGCSNEELHSLGGMPFLLWRAILRAKSVGSRTFELGRTRDDHCGLLRFKNHWSPTAESLTYWTCPADQSRSLVSPSNLRMVQRCCAYVPRCLLVTAGKLMYRHIG